MVQHHKKHTSSWWRSPHPRGDGPITVLELREGTKFYDHELLEEKPAVLASASGTKGVADAVPAGSGQSKPGGANVKGGDRVATGWRQAALNLHWPLPTSLLEIPCSILDILKHSRGGAESAEAEIFHTQCSDFLTSPKHFQISGIMRETT